MTDVAPPLPARHRLAESRWLLVAGWVALVVVHLVVAWQVTGPIVLQDETGYIGNARWLAGQSPVSEMGEAPVYAWGYSLLLAPLTLAIDDPGVLYRWVQVLNSMLLASLLPLLWVMLRQIGGVAPPHALAAALAGSVFPATLVHSSIAWAESLLPVLVVLLVLAVWWALTERPVWQQSLVGPAAVALYATHPRFLPALGLVALGLVAAGLTRRMSRVAAGAALGVIVAGFVVVRVVDAALVDARWPDRVPDEGSAVRLLGRLANPTNWPGVVAGSVGQAWYLAAASLGLAAAGVITLALWVGRRNPLDDPRRLTVAFCGLLMTAVFVTSVVSFVGTAERVDHLIYGRYNEAFVPVLVAVGAMGLIVTTGYRRTRLIATSAGATIGLGVLLWFGRGPDALTGEVVWNNVLGLRSAYELVDQRWMVPVATAMAAFALLGLHLARRRPVVGVAGAALVLSVMGWVAVGPLADFSRVRYEDWDAPDHLSRLVAELDHLDDGRSTIGLDRATDSLVMVHAYPFWSPDTTFRFADTTSTGFGLVLGASEREPVATLGARIVLLDARNDLAVWAVPGTAPFSLLSDRGAVLPRGFPTELPESAQIAAVERQGSGDLEIRAGSSVDIRLLVTHAGTGSPWPSDVEWPLPGVVRVGAQWRGTGGDLIRSDERGELPRPMWPGDSSEATIAVTAADADGTPLPSGRYEVRIGLVQEGFTWFERGDGQDLVVLAITVT